MHIVNQSELNLKLYLHVDKHSLSPLSAVTYAMCWLNTKIIPPEQLRATTVGRNEIWALIYCEAAQNLNAAQDNKERWCVALFILFILHAKKLTEAETHFGCDGLMFLFPVRKSFFIHMNTSI